MKEQAALFAWNEKGACRFGKSLICISLWIRGFADKIVDAGVIDAGKLDEDGDGNVGCADFILAVTRLRDAELGGNGGLLQVVVFAKVTDARIGNVLPHENHLANIIG